MSAIVRIERKRIPPCGGLASVAVLAIGLVISSPDANGYADDPVFSGPQPGEKLTPLNLLGVYDDAAGKEFDAIADAGGKPTLLVVVHKISRPGLGLARGLTNYAKSIGDPPSYAAIVWLSDDKAEAEQFLQRARPSLNIEVPVGISVDGGEGPGSYGLNRNVELTVLVANENMVVANFALIQPSMTDGVKIAGEFAKALGKQPPTAEELQKVAYPNREMNMRNRQRAARGRDGASRGTDPPEKTEKKD